MSEEIRENLGFNEEIEKEEVNSELFDEYEDSLEEEGEEERNSGSYYSGGVGLYDLSDEAIRNMKTKPWEKADLPDALSMYLKEIGNTDLCEGDEEIELSRLAKQGDMEARNRLIEKNLRLVVSIAKRVGSTTLPLEDRISEGNFGLFKAVDYYDPELGYKFSTYATWWIRQAIMRAICNSDSIRIPVHAKEAWFKYYAWEREFVNNTGREPNKKEIDEFLYKHKISSDTFYSMLAVMNVGSLNTPILNDDDHDENELQDFVSASGKWGKTEETALDNTMGSDIRESMKLILTEKEIYILVQRFGLDGGIPRTLESVGAEFNVTRERIRQIEDKALKKLRRNYKVSHTLREYWKSVV